MDFATKTSIYSSSPANFSTTTGHENGLKFFVSSRSLHSYKFSHLLFIVLDESKLENSENENLSNFDSFRTINDR